MVKGHNPITYNQLQALEDLQEITGFTAIITKATHKEGRDNKLFSELILEGKGCSFPIKMWDTANSKEILDKCVEKSIVVEVGLRRKDWEGKYSLNIVSIKIREDLFVNGEDYGVQRLMNKEVFNVQSYIDIIHDKSIKEVCQKFWSRYGEPLSIHPAGQKVHHDFKEGWLEHTIEVVSGGITLMTSPTSPYKERFTAKQIDRYICMALFHDAGKLFEMDNQGSYTLWGRAVGHVYLSTTIFNNAMTEAGVNLENEDYLIILNGIVGHSGQMEWGAFKPPFTVEANLLHLMDMYSLHLSKFIGYAVNPPLENKDSIVFDYSKRQDYFIDNEMKKWRDD